MGRTKNLPQKRLMENQVRGRLVSSQTPAERLLEELALVDPVAVQMTPHEESRVVSIVTPTPSPNEKPPKSRRMATETNKPRAKKKLRFALQSEKSLPDDKIMDEVQITTNQVLIRLANEEEAPPTSSRRKFLLYSYRLRNFQLLVMKDGNETQTTASCAMVRTATGAEQLLAHCANRSNGQWSDVANAIQDGTLQLTCVTTKDSSCFGSIQVEIRLTSQALQLCSATHLPLNARRRTSRQHRPALMLHKALACLFHNTVVSDVVQPRKQSGSNSITAKQVYELIDNVKLHEYEETQLQCESNKEPVKIPNLVPTLRPYQEAAVQWMLKRERRDETEAVCRSDEWQLAWIVLLPPSSSPETDVFCRTVLTAPEWCRQLSEVDEDVVWYCPFAGFLATSAQDAYQQTVGTTEKMTGLESPSGGILGESMGLGKTVEVLACILSNRFPQSPETQEATPRVDGSDQIRLEQNEDREKEAEPLLPTILPDTVIATPDSDSEEEEFEFGEEESSSKPVKEALPSIKPDSDYFSNEACICGETESFPGCLSVLECEACCKPMHGICAGFESLEHVQRESNWRRQSNRAARVCSFMRCPSCVFTRVHESRKLIDSRATLIVTPTSILNQWERELRMHSDFGSSQQLKIVVYPGVRDICSSNRQSRSRMKFIHPSILADADIVLVTFDALMHDLGHSDENPYLQDSTGRSLRTTKKYRVAPSPLTCVKWWRVCLDEAQRVETPTATSAKMAQKLISHHRWCVSGTPVGRGQLDDLYGLFLFLRIEPFSNKDWFQRCLDPHHRGVSDRIKHLLASSMWRSTKASESVRTQMQIPEQVEKKLFLKFSSIERHFYERQLEETLLAAGDATGNQVTIKKKKSANLLANQLHRLRAACCHPQVGSSGIGRPNRKRKASRSRAGGGYEDVNVSSAVLTMEQILDRLIDDAKIKCEEAQRLAVMHTNVLASLHRLKVETNQLDVGVKFPESDEQLLQQSCRAYMETLDLTDANGIPSSTVGEAVLSGSSGFQLCRQIIRDGKACLKWQIRYNTTPPEIGEVRPVWSRVDFEGPSKKIIEIRVRPVRNESVEEGHFECLIPRAVIFQVADTALGGEFVDVASFQLSNNELATESWTSSGSFRTNKSKSWRIVVKDYEYQSPKEKPRSFGSSVSFAVGVEVQLLEADIASDNLQRLHVLHNASNAMESLLQLQSPTATCADMNAKEMRDKIALMKMESRKIESLYMDMARRVHSESQRQLRETSKTRKGIEEELCNLLKKSKSLDFVDCWDDQWWDDMLSIYNLFGSSQEKHSLCVRVKRDLGDFEFNALERLEYASDKTSSKLGREFPDFDDIQGLLVALRFRLADFREQCRDSFSTSMASIGKLSSEPSDSEIFENSHCKECRKDWNQTGPECGHCKLEKKMNKGFQRDPVLISILRCLSRCIHDMKGSNKFLSARKESRLDLRAEKFFAALEAMEKETRAARIAWRTHFDLLSDLDEMNQCKRTIRLAAGTEDLTKLTADELGALVTPTDIVARAMDSGAKQAMALAQLRRHKDTLRYLRNQSRECLDALQHEKSQESNDVDQCPLCLSAFEEEYAVLACGHRFHCSPCLEKLTSRGGSHATIRCPLRCSVSTKRDSVMIASNKRKDDGSKIARQVKGSWGTKVTRLVADVLDVSDLGEKSIVFSQWEDMLEVVEHALEANGVHYVRAKSLSKMGDSIKTFRASDCSVLLMNIKNGAEGLTLVEATHVFMVEPLLNAGLDSQAINRIHRIGQTCKTYVHRYLIQDTIEVKIDVLRMERQADQELEDALHESRKKHDVEGGGIDGGFSRDELEELLR